MKQQISHYLEYKKPSRFQLLNFWRWRLWDYLNPENERPFGILTFTGSAGSGKTISGIEYLARAPYMFPHTKIYIGTNCAYKFQDFEVNSVDDIISAPSNSIIMIDEAGKLFNSRAFMKFDPEWLLPLTQHRKKALQLIFNAQRYGLADKQIRDLSTYIIECSCESKRLVRQDWYEAERYEKFAQKTDEEKQFILCNHYEFVQSNQLRSLYDTYKIIEKFGNSTNKEICTEPKDKEFTTLRRISSMPPVASV